MVGFAQRMHLIRHLLWIDCIAAVLAGTLVLSLGDRLADLYAMPPVWLRLIGTINLLYACLSGTLAMRDKRSVRWVAVLSIANGAWSMACIGIAAAMADTTTAFGMAHLLGESAFVGTLGLLEWRWRASAGRALSGRQPTRAASAPATTATRASPTVPSRPMRPSPPR